MEKTKLDKFESMLMFDDENIIGYSWDIKEYLHEDMKTRIDELDYDELESYISLTLDLLRDLNEHDGLVLCEYHPMGAYTVFDLIKKED